MSAQMSQTSMHPDLVDFLLGRFRLDHTVYSGHQHGLRPELAKHLTADTEAKRRIVETVAHDCRHNDDHAGDLAQMVLGLLALPYAGHPDYRQEWKP